MELALSKMSVNGYGREVLDSSRGADGEGEKAPLFFSGSHSEDSEQQKLAHKTVLTFKNITYSVEDGSGETKQILRGISGYVRAGELLAILGPSGAGKSTLLDIMARNQRGATVGGEVLLQGRFVTLGAFRRIIGYVQQEDLLWPYLTVNESVSYAAYLRNPECLSRRSLKARVERVIRLLDIHTVRDSTIGSELVRGISGGEKKRCSIATELVSRPSLLFLDEPTTGLDTFTALHILAVLREVAAEGVAVVFSIHQPRRSIFQMFDKLLLLNSHGEQAYFGPASGAVPFLASIGITPSQPDNPADILLDAVSDSPCQGLSINAGVQGCTSATLHGGCVVASAFRSSLLVAVENEIAAINRICGELCADLPQMDESPYFCSLTTQIRVVAWRAVLNKIRDPVSTLAHPLASIFFGLVVGSVYFNVGNDQLSIRNRMGALFFVTMNTSFSCLCILNMLIGERAVFTREHRAGFYCVFAYFVGKIIQDVPITLIMNFVFDTIVYVSVGLHPDIERYLLFCALCTLVLLNSYFLCLFVSCVSKNIHVANVLAPMWFVLYLLPSGGILMSVENLPFFWSWLKYVSFVRYGLSGLVVNEFDGLQFVCQPKLPFCFKDGATYARSQGYFPERFDTYVSACAVSVVVYMILSFLALLLRSWYI
uniref:Uncharacterized protein TCIL3000_10_6340 n=1 Tax=Trypanosoma congolense (strain IL3000) TaxID=1068625 RepID=G0UWU4_TRYCI|nr:unnamed protein product [Trypanosoma congolense IL3000]